MSHALRRIGWTLCERGERMTALVDIASQLVARLGAAGAAGAAGVARLRESLEEGVASYGLELVPGAKVNEFRDTRGGCKGYSFREGNRVSYWRRDDVGRDGFTLLHELGHWLVERTPPIQREVGAGADPSAACEAVCDMFAAEILMPDASIAGRFDPLSPTAENLRELWNGDRLARYAATSAVARRIDSAAGVIVVNKKRWEAASASATPNRRGVWPGVLPWAGQPLPPIDELKGLQAGQSLRGRLEWLSLDGRSESVHVDALADDVALYLVVSAANIWRERDDVDEGLAESRRWPSRVYPCCGQGRSHARFPCGTCGEYPCPKCRRCQCERDAEAVCVRCNVQAVGRLDEHGVCTDCRG
jgi:IrrE N-terminal-like domain